MPKLSVCIEMFWRDEPYEERIARVARLGFPAFEFWGWRNKDIDQIEAAMSEHNLPLAGMLLDPGGRIVARNAQADLVEAMKETAGVAQRLGCPTIIATVGNVLDDETYEITRRRVVRHLLAIAEIAEDNGLTLVVEPLNTLVNHHGYWLRRMSEAVDIVDEIDSPAVKILMDIYHQQIQEGNIINNLTTYIDRIGHFHSAGVPGRHELVGGELDYAAIFRAIDGAGYAGHVGLEFSPQGPADEALREALALASR